MLTKKRWLPLSLLFQDCPPWGAALSQWVARHHRLAWPPTWPLSLLLVCPHHLLLWPRPLHLAPPIQMFPPSSLRPPQFPPPPHPFTAQFSSHLLLHWTPQWSPPSDRPLLAPLPALLSLPSPSVPAMTSREVTLAAPLKRHWCLRFPPRPPCPVSVTSSPSYFKK